MKNGMLLLIWVSMLLMMSATVQASGNNLEFCYLENRDGLSNSQVNVILKDSHGFIWLGTHSGLNRFDGYRFRKFYNNNADTTSIPNNTVVDIQEDANGYLWVRTNVGYVLYDYERECFDRHPERWLNSLGIKGIPQRIYCDSEKNLWIFVSGVGCYYLDVRSQRFHLFSEYGKNKCLPAGEVNTFCEVDGAVVVTYNDGTLCKLDGKRQRVIWINRYLAKQKQMSVEVPCTFVDSFHNYWVLCSNRVFVYSPSLRKWFSDVQSFLHAEGVVSPTATHILIKDIKEDAHHRLWIGTDHNGLLLLDMAKKTCTQYLKSERVGSLSDNTIQSIYIDERGTVWIGTYKSGVAIYSPSYTKFSTIPLGDVCTIIQDNQGYLWCGTNDGGIVRYHLTTGQTTRFSGSQIGLESEVVVSSVAASDGSLYFGSYNGGMVRYRQGKWTAFHANGKVGQLVNNSVWALAENHRHQILIGTLGSGLQLFDPQTDLFTTFGQKRKGMMLNYVSSLFTMKNGDVLIGHSQNFSVMDAVTNAIKNYEKTNNGESFVCPFVNDAMVDSRGIFWVATTAGIYMYDPQNGQMESINELNGMDGNVGCSVLEDANHSMWLISEFLVSHVVLSKNKDGKWSFFTTSYNALDGLQKHQFNYRAACLTREGNLVIGGQDGISIINPRALSQKKSRVKALFCGMSMFGHLLKVGEKYDGRVILEKPLDLVRELRLRHQDNTFTVLLATDEVVVPARSRFLYRVDGVSDKWMLTADGSPSITFTNLAPGNYTLQVKVVNGDGTVNDDVSELKIHVAPPFYLSWVAMLFYLFLIGAIYYLLRRHDLMRQREKFERQQMEEDIRKNKELNELKLNFFTNVSHELRSPLTLIISPITMLIKGEQDDGKRRKLELILRSANRLLALVNQILDLRRLDIGKDKLDLAQADFVAFVQNICNSYHHLANNMIVFHFTSSVERLDMLFDIDKVGKIVNNLLSNAYKFTPDGGSVSVSVLVDEELRQVRLSVADTGKGIPDEDKQKVFERFYQVNGTQMQPYGGSGIGLNLVQAFTALHGGSVSISDNPGGGAVFTIELPIRVAETPVVRVPALQPVVVSPVSSSSSASSSSSKPLVLLVDDSDDFREFMRSILEERYQVEEAVNGKDALDKIRQCPPDVILCDVMMPVMDGNQLCREVKGDSALSAIPFVMLTARLAQKQKLEGYESGADDYITKPFDIDLLNLRIRNLLKRTSRVLPPEPSELENASSEAAPIEAVEEESAPTEYVMTEGDSRFMEKVDKYITDNMSNSEMSVESMSRNLYCSRVSLYKRMVSLTGTTPSEYIRAKRIKFAETLLREGEYNVSEIAYRVGFNSPRYFSKYFHEAYGMTPSEYKKKVIG